MWPRIKLISRLLHYLCSSLNPDVLPKGLEREEDCSSQSFERTQPFMMGKTRRFCGYGSKLVISSLHSRNKEEDGLMASGRMSPWRFTCSSGSSLPSGPCFLKVLQGSKATTKQRHLLENQHSHTWACGDISHPRDLPQGLQQVLLSVRAADSSQWRIFDVFYFFNFVWCWVRNIIQYLSHTISTS